MIELRDRMEIPGLDLTSPKNRSDPTPRGYLLHIRERFNDDGTVELIHRKRVYDDDTIVDE